MGDVKLFGFTIDFVCDPKNRDRIIKKIKMDYIKSKRGSKLAWHMDREAFVNSLVSGFEQAFPTFEGLEEFKKGLTDSDPKDHPKQKYSLNDVSEFFYNFISQAAAKVVEKRVGK